MLDFIGTIGTSALMVLIVAGNGAAPQPIPAMR